MKSVPYKVRVESFVYAMEDTRDDSAFAVYNVSQFMLKVDPPHWMAVKGIMRYLKGTLNFKLYLGGTNIALKGFCNADLAGNTNYWRSTMGYVFFFVGVGDILWKCKKQPSIALYTTEAEYMTTSHRIKEIVWLWQLLADVGYVQEGLTSIMCDNQGCIALAKESHTPFSHQTYRCTISPH